MSTAGGPIVMALLAWMQHHTPRLHALWHEEAEATGDAAPAGDAAIRAHLRLVAEALAAHAAPGHEGALERLAAELPELIAHNAGAIEEAVARAREALAFELGLQLGEGARDDPANRAMLGRRARVLALFGFFLRARDDALAPDPPRAEAVEAWMRRQQGLLSVLNARTGRALAARAGAGAGADDTARIAQAAMLQAHVRFLVEAIGASSGAHAG